MKKFYYILFSILIALFSYGLFLFLNFKNASQTTPINGEQKNIDEVKINVEEEKIIKETVKLSAVGDCTIGSDPIFGYSGSFHERFDLEEGNYAYFFNGVSDILANDDITFANLETTFTESTNEEVKTFNFKGPAKYVNILKNGSVEIVNIANNHIYDFKQEGYDDTIKTLKDASIPFMGYNNYYIYNIKGINIGFIGYYVNYGDFKDDIKKGLDYLKSNNVDLIIVSYHWGVEGTYKQNETQVELGHWTIDNGADLVLGHHTHTVQGIEKYNDKYIVYSLGNFVFGGNRNPKDKDTFIFQESFDFENNILINSNINIIPVSLSGHSNYNDYQPQLLYGSEKEKILTKILKYSNINY